VALRIALDPSVDGVGGVAVDPGEPQRGAADPGTVVVAVGQEHRPVLEERVQVARQRTPRTEGGHRPATAEDPRTVRMLLDEPRTAAR